MSSVCINILSEVQIRQAETRFENINRSRNLSGTRRLKTQNPFQTWKDCTEEQKRNISQTVDALDLIHELWRLFRIPQPKRFQGLRKKANVLPCASLYTLPSLQFQIDKQSYLWYLPRWTTHQTPTPRGRLGRHLHSTIYYKFSSKPSISSQSNILSFHIEKNNSPLSCV